MKSKLSMMKAAMIIAVLTPGCYCCMSPAKSQVFPSRVIQASWGYNNNNYKGKSLGAEYSLYCSKKASINFNLRGK